VCGTADHYRFFHFHLFQSENEGPWVTAKVSRSRRASLTTMMTSNPKRRGPGSSPLLEQHQRPRADCMYLRYLQGVTAKPRTSIKRVQHSDCMQPPGKNLQNVITGSQ
jgi:hypothetical protein